MHSAFTDFKETMQDISFALVDNLYEKAKKTTSYIASFPIHPSCNPKWRGLTGKWQLRPNYALNTAEKQQLLDTKVRAEMEKLSVFILAEASTKSLILCKERLFSGEPLTVTL